jgi:O-antigen ligase
MSNIHNSLHNHHVVISKYTSLAFKFLLFMTFVSVGRPQDIFPFLVKLHLGDIAAIGLLCSLFSIQSNQKNKNIFKYTEVRLVTLILILMIALIPFSLVKNNSFHFIKDIYSKTFIFFAATVLLIRTIKDIKYISWTLLLSMLSLSLAVCFTKGSVLGRMSVGTMYDPNDLAMIIVTILPIAMMYSFYSSGAGRLLGIFSAIMGVFATTLTQSRGGFLGLISITILIFFSRLRFKIKYLIILLLLGAILISFSSTSYWDRMSTISKGGSESSERTLIWKRSLRMISKNPFGYGVNNFSSAYGRYLENNPDALLDDPDNWAIYAWKTAHNSFILIGVELGLLGLFIFLFLIYKTYNNFKKIKKAFASDTDLHRYAEFYRISLVGFVVCGFFLSQSYSSMLLTIVAVSSVIVNVIAQETENDRKSIL